MKIKPLINTSFQRGASLPRIEPSTVSTVSATPALSQPATFNLPHATVTFGNR